MSLTNYHPESWEPSWKAASVLTGLLSFMHDDALSTNALKPDPARCRALAAVSFEYNLKNHPRFSELFEDHLETWRHGAASGDSTASGSGSGEGDRTGADLTTATLEKVAKRDDNDKNNNQGNDDRTDRILDPDRTPSTTTAAITSGSVEPTTITTKSTAMTTGVRNRGASSRKGRSTYADRKAARQGTATVTATATATNMAPAVVEDEDVINGVRTFALDAGETVGGGRPSSSSSGRSLSLSGATALGFLMAVIGLVVLILR